MTLAFKVVSANRGVESENGLPRREDVEFGAVGITGKLYGQIRSVVAHLQKSRLVVVEVDVKIIGSGVQGHLYATYIVKGAVLGIQHLPYGLRALWGVPEEQVIPRGVEMNRAAKRYPRLVLLILYRTVAP